jgi:hypothetical protein
MACQVVLIVIIMITIAVPEPTQAFAASAANNNNLAAASANSYTAIESEASKLYRIAFTPRIGAGYPSAPIP